MAHQSSENQSSMEEQLVAYLDGELDAETSRRIETLLATDPQIRQTLQGLDRTWNLLEEVRAPRVNDRFTRTTLEMVTVAAVDEAQQRQAAAARHHRRRWLIAGGSLAAAALAGFLAVTLGAPDPNQQLVQDLPVLERLDELRQIDDLAFLQRLHREGLFAKDDEEE